MWPFSLIPETIDPTLRTIIIVLISIQFAAFLGYMIILCREHKRQKDAGEEEKKEEPIVEKAQKEVIKKESHPYDQNTQKTEERSNSKNKKKLD
jgi:hypothetical protein